MFGIRELKERVDKLEEELVKSQKAISFLLKHDKNEIVFKHVKTFLDDNIEICYAYNGEFKVAKMYNWCLLPIMEETKDINGSTTIIHIVENYLDENQQEVIKVDKYYQLDKIANTLTDITETRKAFLKETEKKTEVEEKLENNEEKVETEKKKIDKNPIKYKDPVNSALITYYHKYNLNVGIKGFSPLRRLSEKEAATLLYLFDQYKYVNEIIKHIDLSRNSVITYAYMLRKAGYLIYSREMGRVANGCLIYGN